jgi:F-type H+-transporting ATPase subunit delta
MINAAVARRYAKGLLGAAVDGGDDLEALSTQLRDLADLVDANSIIELLLLNPAVDGGDKVAVLVELSDRLGSSATVGRFLQVMGANDRLDHLREAVRVFCALADEHLGVINAVITAPQALDAEAIEDLKVKLARATDRAVRIEVKTDPELLGGLTTRIGDVVYDGSLRHQLERMREQIAAS